jgi:hypothetical protein
MIEDTCWVKARFLEVEHRVEELGSCDSQSHAADIG